MMRAPQLETFDGRRLTPARVHPAQYSPAHIEAFTQLLHIAFRDLRGVRRPRVVDGMAGLFGIHKLDPEWFDTVGNEIEAAYVDAALVLYPGRTCVVGNACQLDFPDASFDAYLVSPTFGNRLADHHANSDLCKTCKGSGCDTCWGYGLSLRRSYLHDVRRLAGPDYHLSEHNTGLLSVKAPQYVHLHTLAWAEAARVLRPDGLMVVDVKNFMRAKVEVDVIGLHRAILEGLGFEMVAEQQVAAPGLRNGANRERTKAHTLLVARRPAAG